jgi:hypothetical protein
MLDAEREAQLATERLDRVRRDYQDGKLDADDWREQREQLTEELDGAKREAARLADQEREIDSWGDVCDVEAETLRKLASIRKAIAGEVKDADGIEAVRAALTRLFERFVLDVDGDEATMTPVARLSQSWTTDEQLRPIVRPTPLDLAANNQHQGSPKRYLFAPIPVARARWPGPRCSLHAKAAADQGPYVEKLCSAPLTRYKAATDAAQDSRRTP